MLAFRAFSEMELIQVRQTANTVAKKHNRGEDLTKKDLKDFEPWSLTRLYAGETFFSLFAEMKATYDVVNDMLAGGSLGMLESNQEMNEFRRVLGYVMDRPTELQLGELVPTISSVDKDLSSSKSDFFGKNNNQQTSSSSLQKVEKLRDIIQESD